MLRDRTATAAAHHGAAGQLPEAGKQEGEAVVIEGSVAHGDERGRQLGFPTANLHDVSAVRLDGVYAATFQVDPARSGARYVAAVSVGHRPTYYGRDGIRLLEAHLLDFDGDLYGRWVRIELRVRLRPQHRFVDTPTLVRQLRLDVAATRAWAMSNRLEHLLAPAPSMATGRRHRVGRGGGIDRAARADARNARRMAAIAQVVRDTEPHRLSHPLVSERTGIPLGYLRWRFPSVTDFTALG
jgi:riboflavin kinase / FMN adenylyltransferase